MVKKGTCTPLILKVSSKTMYVFIVYFIYFYRWNLLKFQLRRLIVLIKVFVLWSFVNYCVMYCIAKFDVLASQNIFFIWYELWVKVFEIVYYFLCFSNNILAEELY